MLAAAVALQSGCSIFLIPADGLVNGHSADAEVVAQLADREFTALGQVHEASFFVHQVFSFPRHFAFLTVTHVSGLAVADVSGSYHSS